MYLMNIRLSMSQRKRNFLRSQVNHLRVSRFTLMASFFMTSVVFHSAELNRAREICAPSFHPTRFFIHPLSMSSLLPRLHRLSYGLYILDIPNINTHIHTHTSIHITWYISETFAALS